MDGHSVIYRSFYAFIRRPLRNSRGFNTSAVYGFAQTLGKLLRELRPDHCAVVFDAPGETFRHRRYEEYKIHRQPAPDELVSQIPVVKRLVAAMGVQSIEQAGVEADDVLATLATRGAAQGMEVVLATTDKDLLQLVGGPVAVLDPWKEIRYGPAEVRERMGVGPEQIPDLLALMGDASDNIPGVPGIGPKRANDIMARFGSLDRALVEDERVKPHAQVALLSRELATVRTDVETGREPRELLSSAPNRSALAELYEEMGFRGLLAETEAGEQGEPRDQKPEARDRSSGGLELGRAFVFELADGAVWVTRNGRDADRLDPVELAQLLDRHEGVTFDYRAQYRAMGRPQAEVFDVRIGAWLCDSNRSTHTLAHVAGVVLGNPVVAAGPEERIRLIARAYVELVPRLAALGLERLWRDIEMPLVPVLARMEERGVKVDADLLSRLEREFGAEMAKAEQRVAELAGTQFNIDSPKQLAVVLFERLGLPRGRRTKTGYSTDSEVLERLVGKHPIVQEVLRYRELAKLGRTYVKPLREAALRTGRVHTTFDQTGTSTGRLSTMEPNLQNIPVRTPEGRRLREAFVAEPGNVLVSADYSQIELRALAHISGDTALAEAFRLGEDIHTWTAAEVLGVPADKVGPDERRLAKAINYGLVYGMGERNLAASAGIPVEQARTFLEAYMVRFEGVVRWRDRVLEQAKAEGVARTLSGRIRPVPGVVDPNRAVAEAAKRAAINAPVQGSAADIVKTAMLRCEERLEAARLVPGLLLQVHDELLFEVEQGRVEEATGIIKETMEGAWRLNVPLAVEVRAGRTWGEAH